MRRFLINIYAYSFFTDFILIYPIYAVMFMDFGLTPLQISILFMAWAGTAFVFEVPSGVFADKYPRKNILIFAEATRIVGYLLWLFFPSFIGFLLGFVLWGIKSAFTSGTYESLIYDELKVMGQEGNYTKIIGRTQGIHFASMLLAGVGASLAIRFGYSIVLLLSILSLAFSSLTLSLLPRADAVQSTQEKRYFHILREGLRFAFSHSSVLRIIVFVAFAQTLFGALDEYWSIFAYQVGLPLAGIGLFHTMYDGVQALATLIAHRAERLPQQLFYLFFLINGILLLIASTIFTVLTLPILFIFCFLFTITDIVMYTKLHHQIPSATRATIASVRGFFVELGSILVFLFFGLFAKVLGYQYSFVAFGWIIIIIGLTYLVTSIGKNYERDGNGGGSLTYNRRSHEGLLLGSKR